MAGEKVPDCYHILRDVTFSKLKVVLDSEGNEIVLGAAPAAFQLRELEDGIEDYLSATCCEYLEKGGGQKSIKAAAERLKSKRKLGKKARFFRVRVGDLKEALKSRSINIRVIHEPDEKDDAHVAIRRWPVENFDNLFEMIAEDIWNEMFTQEQISSL